MNVESGEADVQAQQANCEEMESGGEQVHGVVQCALCAVEEVAPWCPSCAVR